MAKLTVVRDIPPLSRPNNGLEGTFPNLHYATHSCVTYTVQESTSPWINTRLLHLGLGHSVCQALLWDRLSNHIPWLGAFSLYVTKMLHFVATVHSLILCYPTGMLYK
jgi:hypothetical protein